MTLAPKPPPLNRDNLYPYFHRKTEYGALVARLGKLCGIRRAFNEDELIRLSNLQPVLPPENGRPLHRSLAGRSNIDCKLVAPIAGKVDRAEMWIACVPSMDGPDAWIVLKVYRESLGFKDLRYVHRQDFTPVDWEAKNEALFYEEAAALQGTVIPYFFGLHKVSFIVISLSVRSVLGSLPGMSDHMADWRRSLGSSVGAPERPSNGG